jgi:hypothetical protein
MRSTVSWMLVWDGLGDCAVIIALANSVMAMQIRRNGLGLVIATTVLDSSEPRITSGVYCRSAAVAYR